MPFFERGSFHNPFEFHKKYDFDKEPVIASLTQRIHKLETINAYGGIIDKDGKPLWFLKDLRKLEKLRYKHHIDHPDEQTFKRIIELSFPSKSTYECMWDGEVWTVSKIRKKQKVMTTSSESSEEALWVFERMEVYPKSERDRRHF